MVCGHAAADQGGNHGTGARHCPYIDSFPHAFPHQVEGGVCNARGSGVADQGDVPLFFQVAHVFRGDRFLVKIVVSLHGRRDPEVVEENPRVSGVLGKNQRDFFQYADRTVSDVLHVPDGGCHDV